MTIILQSASQQTSLSDAAFLDRLTSTANQIGQPFSDHAVSVLNALSRKFMVAPEAKAAPQILAFGFWLRKSAIKEVERQLHPVSDTRYAVPRGLAFHLPPSNVDTLFAYSWALSFLVGNTNVVRLPSEINPITAFLTRTIIETLAEFGLDTSQYFCSFSKDNDLVRDISALSDLRVIWGGDEKVLAVSRFPVRPDGLSIGFPDRKSISIISTLGFAALNDVQQLDLARKLYNDIYWFDQLGCGSPRALIWLGDGPDLRLEFYKALQEVIDDKKLQTETDVAISKFVFANEMIGTKLSSSAKRYSNELSVLQADIQHGLLENTHGGGILFDCRCETVSEIVPLVQRNLQTITHFGFSKDEMEELKSIINGQGGFRIVYLGEALSFAPLWDGLDLITMFTRQVAIQPSYLILPH